MADYVLRVLTPEQGDARYLGASGPVLQGIQQRMKADDMLAALYEIPLPPDDRPTVTWSSSMTSSFTSPVTVKPSIVGTGTQVSNWNSWTGTPDPNFHVDPGVFGTANGGSSDLEIHGETKPGGSAQAASWPYTVEFITSETDAFEVGIYDTGSSAFILEVGGISAGYFQVPSGLATGKKFNVTFPRSGRRHIRLVGVPRFSALYLKTGQSITKPVVTRRVGAIIGDSYVGGAGGTYGLSGSGAASDRGTTQITGYAPRLLRAMGSNAHVLAGIGGTGLVATSPTSHYQTRVAAVNGFSPNFLVVTGSINDPSNGNGVQAAVEALLASTTSIPERYLMTVTRQGWEACNTAIRAGVAAHGNSNVKIIEVDGILDGTGNSINGGTGMRGQFLMSDNSHPNQAGHDYILRRAVREYLALI